MSVNSPWKGMREDDALVGVLKEVGVVVVEDLAHHDMAALDQAQRLRFCGDMGVLGQKLRGPRARGIDQRARVDHLRGAAVAAQRHAPGLALPTRVHARAARQHRGAALGGVHGNQSHQPRVVHPAVGKHEDPGELLLQAARRWGCRASPSRETRAAPRAGPGGRTGTSRRGSSRPAACCGLCGITKRKGQMMWGAQRSSRSRSISDLRTMRELVVLQVAQTAVDELGGRTTEVCEARSSCSHSTTRWPRPARSRAMPTPLTPPPTMSTSHDPAGCQHGAPRWQRGLPGARVGRFDLSRSISILRIAIVFVQCSFNDRV